MAICRSSTVPIKGEQTDRRGAVVRNRPAKGRQAALAMRLVVQHQLHDAELAQAGGNRRQSGPVCDPAEEHQGAGLRALSII
jgi:hypothetical protein